LIEGISLFQCFINIHCHFLRLINKRLPQLDEITMESAADVCTLLNIAFSAEKTRCRIAYNPLFLGNRNAGLFNNLI
jgi:hypothetical protein